jgi:tRNA nucleotidyltransferase (CCA-adding enzyme)
MSDYMFMLESHLSSDQGRVVSEVQTAAAQANVNVFLTGGAMRDMLGGFPIHEVDFTVEGNAIKLARAIAHKTGAEILQVDENRKSAQLRFPGPVYASIGMARQEKYSKPGAKPQVQPATIHEDLRGRDFTINSIALSLNAASRGLLLDPNNGVGDLAHKELRAVTNFTLYDDPVRLLRLIRFKVRLGFTVGERTQLQYANAREAGLESRIPPQALMDELRHIADEPNISELVKAIEDEGLLHLFSPALSGAKINMAGLQKLQKARQMVPFGAAVHPDNLGLFLHILTEKFTPAEKTALVRGLGMDKEDVDKWQKIESRSKKLEKDLKSAKLQKASQIYHVLSKAPGDQTLFLLLRSPERLVQDRIKNYLQKYLPASLEITEREVVAAGGQPGTPKYDKLREELIATRLDARPKKVPPPEPVPEVLPPPPPTSPFARR